MIRVQSAPMAKPFCLNDTNSDTDQFSSPVPLIVRRGFVRAVEPLCSVSNKLMFTLSA
ncbi:hypothetical protein Syun_006331 [Stephania yunnanensis]|uniref:Uncharacterized protein n=1 Tax=Stephania yunnanensis TaxID=152371 RepID=A0AAP0KZ12_9MAGN